ncbi:MULTISPECIES: hypothetical protein [unclassified Methylobacterium]|uniref:hypothetical protein n=1 Tax=unclassified Methylobacterium TaxID=2615210 RepID=UPI001FB99FDA|nr:MULTISPECIES: hypothetical protein [unclassified Methylobacterium]MCJ2091255.1 hypothetical protein [Methylobacterium sp. J-072]MCJ2143154.1 hypothetical protein [Methylobacterium sp. E-066]
MRRSDRARRLWEKAGDLSRARHDGSILKDPAPVSEKDGAAGQDDSRDGSEFGAFARSKAPTDSRFTRVSLYSQLFIYIDDPVNDLMREIE